MATNYIDKIKGTDNVTYDIRDSGALQLTGGQVTGPVTFGDTVQIDDLTAGNAVVTGSASVTNNLQVNTINGVTVGPSPEFTDTNTEVSAFTLASDTGTSSITLSSAGKYKLTAGSKNIIFTMPTIPTVSYPVTSVNNKTGAVSLSASDVGAATSSHTHSVEITPSTTNVYSMTSAGNVTAGTANVPTKIDTTKFNGGSYSHTGFSGGSFTRGAFTGGSLTMGINANDTKQLDITFTAATHAADSFTAAVYGTDSFTAASLSTGFYTAGTANTPTAVTLPGRSSAIATWTGYTSATAKSSV